MTDLTRLRDALRAGLTDAPKEGEPTVGELARAINDLRASQVIVSGPERSAAKAVSAEEPVTARITRHMEQPEVNDQPQAEATGWSR